MLEKAYMLQLRRVPTGDEMTGNLLEVDYTRPVSLADPHIESNDDYLYILPYRVGSVGAISEEQIRTIR